MKRATLASRPSRRGRGRGSGTLLALLPLVALLLLLLLPLATTGAAAQVPGGNPTRDRERKDAARARLRAMAMQGVQRTLEDWSDAWMEDDADKMAELYRRAASVRGLPFGARAGRERIVRELDRYLEDNGSVTLEMQEFDASGELAYAVASYRYRRLEAGAPGGALQQGTVLMVFRRRGDDWRIRSQLFRPEQEEDTGDA